MNEEAIGYLVVLLCCLVFAAFGYAIRYKGKLSLIAGYDKASDDNPDRTSYTWGLSLLTSSILTIVILNALTLYGSSPILTLAVPIACLMSFLPIKWWLYYQYQRNHT